METFPAENKEDNTAGVTMVDCMISMPEDEMRECLCQADPDQQHQGAQVRRQIEYTPAFKHPVNMILAGPSSSGKTYYLARMLEADLIEPRPESIHLFTGVKDSTVQDEVLDDFEGRKLIIMVIGLILHFGLCFQ